MTTVLFIGMLAVFHLAVTERAERPASDPCSYLLLAENLREHGKYEFNSVPHMKYPPGFPLLLAGWMMISGSTDYAHLLRLGPAFGALGLIAWFFALRSAFHPAAAALGVILVGISQSYFSLATRFVLSELPYIFFTGVTFLLSLRLITAPDPPKRMRLAMIALLLFSAPYAVAIRTAGVAAGGALLLWAFSRPVREIERAKSARMAAVAAGLLCVLVCAGWIAWSRTELTPSQKDGAMTSYGEEFVLKNVHEPDQGVAEPLDYAVRIAGSIPLRAAQAAAVVLPLGWIAPVWYSPMMCILFLSLLGVSVQRGDAKKLLFGLYFVLYLGVFLLWPFEEDSRFVLPVMPIAIVFLADGARAAWEGALRAPRIAGGAASVFFLCAALTALWRPPVGRQEWLSLMIAGVIGFAGIVVLFARRAAEALERLHAAMRNRVHPLAMALVAVLLVLNLSGQVLGASENLHPDRSKYVNEPYRQASLWFLQAPPGNVMAGGCAMVHRYSRRPCFRFFPTSNPDRNLASIRRNAIRFLVVIRERKDRPPYYRPSEVERLKGLQGKEPELLRVIQEDRNFIILETAPSVWDK